jgi:hypothetical protein
LSIEEEKFMDELDALTPIKKQEPRKYEENVSFLTINRKHSSGFKVNYFLKDYIQ